MHVLWHVESCCDYAHFPESVADGSIAVPCLFTKLGEQTKAYELWRRCQEQEFYLHAFLSHFDNFLPYPEVSEFFDFHKNILKRRYQAFVDYRSDEPLILLSPGVFLPSTLDMSKYTQLAMEKNALVAGDAPSANFDNNEVLTGFWVIPPVLQNEFAKPLPDNILADYMADDLGYWWAVANRTVEICHCPIDGLSNYIPEYSRFNSLPDVGPNDGEPFTGEVYPEWSREDFVSWTNRSQFRLAQTMRWCPHEYVIWNKDTTFEERLEYLMAADYIHRNVHVNEWRGRFQFALMLDGTHYWYVSNENNSEALCIVNRTSRELQRRVFAEDGKDEWGRKIKDHPMLFE